jgi:hypothetical protein
MQPLRRTIRRDAQTLTLTVLLAFCVFQWGLHYKLSLYHVVANEQSRPAAKLLSQRERPVASVHTEGFLLSGSPIPTASLSIPSAFAAFLTNTSLAIPFGYMGAVEALPGPDASCLRHPGPCSLRGPPTAI